MEYRVEKKYLCTDYEIAILKNRLQNLLPSDVHQSGECYMIRSVYFDTIYNDCFFENMAGVNHRSKYRIRIYNNSDEQIHFEIKEKCNGYIKKQKYPMSRQACEEALEGMAIGDVFEEQQQIRNRILLQQKTTLLKPVIVIDYERSAFVLPIGNVRITFDRNIAASLHVQDFFEENARMVPLLRPQQHLLEVKYDELLPDYVARALNLETLRRVSFSKYCLGRQVLEPQLD